MKRNSRRFWNRQINRTGPEIPLDQRACETDEPETQAHPMRTRAEGILQARDLIEKALSSLPARYADVWFRCDYMGESQADVARDMQRRPATIRTWLHRARARMKSAIRRLERPAEKVPSRFPPASSPHEITQPPSISCKRQNHE